MNSTNTAATYLKQRLEPMQVKPVRWFYLKVGSSLNSKYQTSVAVIDIDKDFALLRYNIYYNFQNVYFATLFKRFYKTFSTRFTLSSF